MYSKTSRRQEIAGRISKGKIIGRKKTLKALSSSDPCKMEVMVEDVASPF
jgi:hypothetical protein